MCEEHCASRVKNAVLGPIRLMFRSEIPASKMQQDPHPDARALQSSGATLAPGAFVIGICLGRAAAGRLMLLSDATASNDDVNEDQLGKVLFEDSNGSTLALTRIAVVGSKSDSGGRLQRWAAGKLAALPAVTKPGSGAASPVDLARSTMERLLAAP